MILIGTAVACFLLLGVVGAFGARVSRDRTRDIVYGGTALACGLLALLTLARLAGADIGGSLELPIGLPWLKARLVLDDLSAFFVMVVNIAGVSASVFGWGYDRAHDGLDHGGGDHGGGGTPPSGPVLPLFPLFLAGMNLVLLADDAFMFLVSWEFMSVASWLLVLSTHRESETPRAARVYLVMAGFGTAALLLAFGLLSGSDGAYGFTAIRGAAHPSGAASLAVMLVLLGAGSKAGIVPLHVWLPLAHPAAPSHVSALMSGVMTKVAIYAIVRVLFDLVGATQWWWGGVLMGFGAVTAVLGVLYAILQDDLKKLLAYSTVENIGIIVVALGLAVTFKAAGAPETAALALSAALLHVYNHSLFKSLLFYGAGAVLAATGERDLNRLGGLIHRMPVTAVTALIGAASISALPPLNGFVSEWMTFQAILNGPGLPSWELKIGVAVIGALVALSAALAATCFVRFYGIVFLGRPRSAGSAHAVEVNLAMRLAMAAPAAACIGMGVLPTPLLAMFMPVTRSLVGATAFDGTSMTWLWLTPTSAIGNSYSGFIMLAVIGALSAVLAYGIHRLASNKVRRAPAWGCGFTDPDPAGRWQYTPSSFGQPIRRVFGSVAFAARDEVDMPSPGEVRPARFRVVLRDPAWDFLFTPITQAVHRLADWTNVLQFMTIRSYLTLMFGALVVLLIMVALSQGSMSS